MEDNKIIWIKNILYFSTFLVFGMTIGMSGPALMEILLLYFDKIDVINALAYLLFSQALTRFLGAAVAGVLSDRFQCNYSVLLAFCMGSNAVIQFIIPLARELWCLVTLTASSGLFAGIMDTSTNIALINMHGTKVAPYIQCLYFFYGFGAFASPLISEPFLRKDKDKHIKVETMLLKDFTTSNHSNVIIHETLDRAPFLDPNVWTEKSGKIEMAFWIVAILHVPVIFGLTIIGLLENNKHKLTKAVSTYKIELNDEYEQESVGESVSESVESSHEFRKKVAISITVFTSIIVFIFDGLQGSFGGYIFTYGEAINMSASQGAVLTSLFWGFLAIGRLLSIPLAVYLLPSSMVKISLTFSLIITVVMMIFHHHSLVIWFGTCIFAVSMGNIFPSSLSMIEQYFPVTGTVACTFVVSAAIGETVVPLVVGELFDRYGTIMFMGCAVVLCSISCFCFGILQILTTMLYLKKDEE